MKTNTYIAILIITSILAILTDYAIVHELLITLHMQSDNTLLYQTISNALILIIGKLAIFSFLTYVILDVLYNEFAKLKRHKTFKQKAVTTMNKLMNSNKLKPNSSLLHLSYILRVNLHVLPTDTINMLLQQLNDIHVKRDDETLANFFNRIYFYWYKTKTSDEFKSYTRLKYIFDYYKPTDGTFVNISKWLDAIPEEARNIIFKENKELEQDTNFAHVYNKSFDVKQYTNVVPSKDCVLGCDAVDNTDGKILSKIK